MSERENGFYWVRLKGGDWEVARWDAPYGKWIWWFAGDDVGAWNPEPYEVGPKAEPPGH